MTMHDLPPRPHRERMAPEGSATPREEIAVRALLNDLEVATFSPLQLKTVEGRLMNYREYPLSGSEYDRRRTLVVGYDAVRDGESPVTRTITIEQADDDGTENRQTLYLNAVRRPDGSMHRPIVRETATEVNSITAERSTREFWHYLEPGEFEPFVHAVAELGRAALQN